MSTPIRSTVAAQSADATKTEISVLLRPGEWCELFTRCQIYAFIIEIRHPAGVLSLLNSLVRARSRAQRVLRCRVCIRAVRRRRPHVGDAPAPFSCRVHVMLYTSYMLLDFCNAVYNEAWTLTKSNKNDAGVFRSVKAKVFSWTIL